jgi:RNA polymerase sigma-70 factor (ECF subfamily)
LVSAAQADPHAFDALYERYLTQIYRYCYVRLGNREAAEDATSEVFLKALRGLDEYRGGTFIAWLYRIAGNVIIDTYRRRSHSTCPIENIGYLEDDAPTPETAAIMRAERSELNHALASLPPEYRTVIVLQLAGWTGEQIACTLDKTPAAVKMLRFRAVGRLRLLLGSPLQHELQHDKEEVYHG